MEYKYFAKQVCVAEAYLASGVRTSLSLFPHAAEQAERNLLATKMTFEGGLVGISYWANNTWRIGTSNQDTLGFFTYNSFIPGSENTGIFFHERPWEQIAEVVTSACFDIFEFREEGNDG